VSALIIKVVDVLLFIRLNVILSKMQKEQNEKDASNKLKQLQTEIVYYNPVTPVYIAGNEVRFIEETEKTSYYNRLYSFLFTSYLEKPPEVATLS
jgi:hypothetical protein